MKPFDLEAAKKGDACITRDGKPVVVVFVSKYNETYPVKGVIDYGNKWAEECWTLDGRFHEENMTSSDAKDLFMAPTTKKLWIAIDKTQLSTGKYMTSEASEFASEIAAPFAAWLVQVEVEL